MPFSSSIPVQWRTERRRWATPLRWIAIGLAVPLLVLSVFGQRHGGTPWDGLVLLFLPAAAFVTSLLKRGFATSAIFRGNADYGPTLLIGTVQREGRPFPIVAEYPRPDGHVYVLPSGDRIVASGVRGLFPTFGLTDNGRPRPLSSVSLVWVIVRYILTLLGAFVATVIASMVSGASDRWMVAFLTTFSCLFFLATTRRTTLQIGADGVRLRDTLTRTFAPWGAIAVDRVRRKLTLNGVAHSFVTFQYDLDEVDAALASIEEHLIAGERLALHAYRRQPEEPASAFRVRIAEAATNYRVADGRNDDDRLLHGTGIPNDLRFAAAFRVCARGGEVEVRAAAARLLDRRLAAALVAIADGSLTDTALDAALDEGPPRKRRARA